MTWVTSLEGRPRRDTATPFTSMILQVMLGRPLPDFPGEPRGYTIGDTWNGEAWFGFGQSNSGALNDLWVYNPGRRHGRRRHHVLAQPARIRHSLRKRARFLLGSAEVPAVTRMIGGSMISLLTLGAKARFPSFRAPPSLSVWH
jgi:hypothetical protein